MAKPGGFPKVLLQEVVVEVVGECWEVTRKIFRSLPMGVYSLLNGRGGDSGARTPFEGCGYTVLYGFWGKIRLIQGWMQGSRHMTPE